MEEDLLKEIEEREKSILAVRSIKKIVLNKIDFDNEVIPLDNFENFKGLLNELKGEELTDREEDIAGILFDQNHKLKNTF